MPKKFMRVIALLIILISFSTIHAQSFGFGCLGLAGFYAGVSEYRYETPGIDEFANSYSILFSHNYTTEWKDVKFTKGTGYRIGTNFFRAKWDRIFVSVKGYYQFLKEEHSNVMQTGSTQTELKYQLTMNHWGLGVDVGVQILGIIDWKIIEGSASFYNSEFIFSQYTDNKFISEEKYSPDKLRIGYYLGTGLILQLIPDYISFEGSVGFNFLQIDHFSGSSNSFVPVTSSSKNAVDKGGWSGTIQLNVGFPL